MCQATEQQIIEILKMEAIPALGCTEPVACALACARCKEELGGVPEQIDVFVSGNIYKNGMAVGMPGAGGARGNAIAAALGAICGDASRGLEVLAGTKPEDVKKAEAWVLRRDDVREGAPLRRIVGIR